MELRETKITAIQPFAFRNLLTIHFSIYNNVIYTVHEKAFLEGELSGDATSQPLLVGLFMYRNQIAYLTPGTFDCLTTLEILNLGSNNLTIIDKNLIVKLSVLKMASFSNNPIAVVEFGFAPKSLISLEIKNTLVKHLSRRHFLGLQVFAGLYLPANISLAPDCFAGLSSLNMVEIGLGNALTCSCDLWWYENTKLDEQLMCDDVIDISKYLNKECVVLNTGMEY